MPMKKGRPRKPSAVEPVVLDAADAEPAEDEAVVLAPEIEVDAEPALAADADVELEPAEPADADAPDPDLAEPAEPTALIPVGDSLQRYLAEIRRIPVLTREEEHVLAVQWKEQQDRTAAWKLVTHNLRLVAMIARDYQRAATNLLDLIQEGNVGLLDAIKNFDPYRGIRFPSYAVWWIRAYVIRYIMNNWRMVKIGTTQAQRKLFFNLQKERERLEREGFTPNPKLIAEGLGVKEREVVEMEQRMAGRDASVDAPVGDDGDGSASLLDFLAGPQQTAESVADDQYHRLIRDKATEFKRTLKGKDLDIYERRLEALMRDEEPVTLQEIGDQYGISRERVRQIEARLKKKLGNYLREQIPDIRDIEFGA